MSDIRAEHAKLSKKIEALDWLDAQFPGAKGDKHDRHADSCNYLDDTGYPAPCSCGAAERFKLYDFVKHAIEKA